MRKTIFSALSCLILLCFTQSISAAFRERINFDSQWHFAFGNASDPKKDFGCGTEYFNYFTKANSIHNEGPYTIRFKEDAKQWKVVDLPYDFVIDLPFEEKASYSHGHKTVGWQYPETSVGWYRKTFHLPESDRGKHIRLQFDGIFRDAQIWVNGTLVGQEKSGYIHHDYDITDYLFYGEGADKTNLVCVRADATYEEGWFYEGAGIYRHTWLVKTAPVHVTTGGTFIHADVAGDFKSAMVTIEAEVQNDDFTPVKGYTLEHQIISPDGSVVATVKADGKALQSHEAYNSIARTTLNNVKLWSLETPSIYKIRTKVIVDGQVVDEYLTKTGFRDIRYDKDNGMFLNGKHVKLHGFNGHQDFPGVGAGMPDGLQLYRIEKLKEIGMNAYRSSHNPATKEFLDVCDSLGILVYEENRLMGVNDIELRVAQNMIRMDRNHPSIFAYGISNEEWGFEWDERSINIAKHMTEVFHRADPTRPTSYASASGPQPLKGVDIAGYNYITQNPVDEHRRNFPDRIAMGTEETTGCGTRGIYFHEKPELLQKKDEKDNENLRLARANTLGRRPARNRMADIDVDSMMNRIERSWKFYDERPYLLGMLYWTGFDYRGEPTPLEWPATHSASGMLDYCGFPKDEAFYCKAWWKPEETTLHILPHWNLQGHEGETVDVWVYSNCDEVELKVNGKNLGRQKMPKDGHLSWKAIYKPGRVEAIGYKNGKKIATERIETTGEATQVHVDKKQYGDVIVANISLYDKKGRWVPTACNDLTVNIINLHSQSTSQTRILGWGNGNSAFHSTETPTTPDAKTMKIKAFNGYAQVILKGKVEDCYIKVNF